MLESYAVPSSKYAYHVLVTNHASLGAIVYLVRGNHLRKISESSSTITLWQDSNRAYLDRLMLPLYLFRGPQISRIGSSGCVCRHHRYLMTNVRTSVQILAPPARSGARGASAMS